MATIIQRLIITATDDTEYAAVKTFMDTAGITVADPISPIMSRIDDSGSKTVAIECDVGSRTQW